ncbi:MAG TPA: DUF3048 domain-containing protein [Candidatus Dormibacteraeota bacterium]|nr:DUF3048 domain-containing protein [Candidatus Dormibacteraeota bacterium]
MTWTQTLRERWWLAPIALLLVAAAIVIRIITTPLEVSANVSDGEQAVPRTATIDLRFNQEMKADSVAHAFSMTPSVLVAFKAVSLKEFQFRPKMKPNTAYHVSLKDAQNTSGRGVSSGFSFKTEPAPAIAAVKVNDQALTDGQQGIKPTGNVQIDFLQPMDSGKTPIAVNGRPFDSKQVSWSSDGKTASLDLKLGYSHPYELSIPQTAVNRKQDPLAAGWKLAFTTIIAVPSQGDPNRIGSGAPVIIQIENSIDARPQAGMQQADMIYEYISEGSIPRLSAVYWHPLPDLVGPVRSCRLITIRLELMYKGMIYCSGANDYILGLVWKYPNLVNDYSRGAGNVFYRDNATRFAPHNVMMHGNNVAPFTAAHGIPAPLYDIAPKHPDATFAGDAALTISVPDHGASWQYDAGSRQYLKTQDGRPFNNVGTGRVHAKTVIVEYVTSFLDTHGGNSFHGYYTEAYELTGDGKADIFVDGVVIHATWHHPDPNVPAVYLDANGNPIELDNGLTWVHVIGSQKWHSGI